MRTYKWEIRLVLVLILATGIFARSIAIESPSYLSKLENDVLQELNLARTNPADVCEAARRLPRAVQRQDREATRERSI
jgi:hypothetical protein